ncbi:hypothetical protein [Achromobacter aegrifaciens]
MLSTKRFVFWMLWYLFWAMAGAGAVAGVGIVADLWFDDASWYDAMLSAALIIGGIGQSRRAHYRFAHRLIQDGLPSRLKTSAPQV